MSGSFKGLNQQQIDRRLKEGRGEGIGPDYKPFIYTRDVSSLGRSHRLFGQTSNRLHHLLSDLELAVFLVLDWSEHVTDIREQFPMRVDDTARIAEELGLPYFRYKDTHQVLTTDFLVDFADTERPQMVLQAKYSNDLQKPSTIERLMIEKRYWEEKQIPWALVTEKEISKTIFSNIEWLYPAQGDDASEDDLIHHFELFDREFGDQPDKKIIAVAQKLDMSYELESGESLYWLRQLLARRYFIFDLNILFRDLTCNQLIPCNLQTIAGVMHAAG